MHDSISERGVGLKGRDLLMSTTWPSVNTDVLIPSIATSSAQRQANAALCVHAA